MQAGAIDEVVVEAADCTAACWVEEVVAMEVAIAAAVVVTRNRLTMDVVRLKDVVRCKKVARLAVRAAATR